MSELPEQKILFVSVSFATEGTKGRGKLRKKRKRIVTTVNEGGFPFS